MNQKLQDLVKGYITGHRDEFLQEMVDFCRVPSVTSDTDAIHTMADIVEQRLRKSGFEVTRDQVEGGHPAFVAHLSGSSERSLLFFNHYDVDPPGKEDLWESPPFDPRIEDGKVYARGIADNKGSLLSRLHTVDACLEVQGSLPCSVTFLIEAKRSMQAPHLGMFVDRYRDLLHADACLWENSTVSSEGRPTFRLGDKGMLMVRIISRGTRLDLSSQYAPIFPSAAWTLVWFLSRLKDRDRGVLLEEFGSAISPLSPKENAILRSMPVDVKGLEDLAGVPLHLEDDPDALVRYFSEPTTNIARLQAGPQGEGKMMSVNPNSASADMDLRLVPDQHPQRVFEKLEELAREVGEGTLELEHLGEMPPGRTPVDHPFVTLMSDIAEDVYGSSPILEPLSPTVGSRSVLSWSGMPVVGYGISYSGSNIQAPNEHIRITDYETGMTFLSELLDRLAQESASPGR